jgi:hypothetical protein
MLRDPPPQIANDKLEIRDSPETSGKGVYVREGAIVYPGEVLTAYPGKAKWMTAEAIDFENKKRKNPYVFCIGPMSIRNHTEMLFLTWDGSFVHYNVDERTCGHLINTMHPRSCPPWNSENCMFAVYVDRLKLDYSYEPEASLYILGINIITGGAQALPIHELRLDYHAVLAAEFGMWCLNLRCVLCRRNLIEFVLEHIIPLEEETNDEY